MVDLPTAVVLLINLARSVLLFNCATICFISCESLVQLVSHAILILVRHSWKPHFSKLWILFADLEYLLYVLRSISYS